MTMRVQARGLARALVIPFLALTPVACEPAHAATGDLMPQLGANLFLEDFLTHDQAARWDYGYTLWPNVVQDRTTAAGTGEVGITLDGNFLGLGVSSCDVSWGFLKQQAKPLPASALPMITAASARAVSAKQMTAYYGGRVSAVRQATCMMQVKKPIPVPGTVFQAKAMPSGANGDWSGMLWGADWATGDELDFAEYEPRWSGRECYNFSEHHGAKFVSAKVCPGVGDLSKGLHTYGGYIDGDYAVAIFDGREAARLKSVSGWSVKNLSVITNLAEGPLGYSVEANHVGVTVVDWIRADARK